MEGLTRGALEGFAGLPWGVSCQWLAVNVERTNIFIFLVLLPDYAFLPASSLGVKGFSG